MCQWHTCQTFHFICLNSQYCMKCRNLLPLRLPYMTNILKYDNIHKIIWNLAFIFFGWILSYNRNELSLQPQLDRTILLRNNKKKLNIANNDCLPVYWMIIIVSLGIVWTKLMVKLYMYTRCFSKNSLFINWNLIKFDPHAWIFHFFFRYDGVGNMLILIHALKEMSLTAGSMGIHIQSGPLKMKMCYLFISERKLTDGLSLKARSID